MPSNPRASYAVEVAYSQLALLRRLHHRTNLDAVGNCHSNYQN